MNLLGAIARLVRRRPAMPERTIFRFFDGTTKRAADPLEAWRAIEQTAGKDWMELLRLLTDDPPPGVVGGMADRHREAQEAAATKLGEAACVAFGVTPLAADGRTGLTRAERVGLVGSFLNYMGGLAESARVFRGSGGSVRDAVGVDVPGSGGPVGAPEGSPATAGA